MLEIVKAAVSACLESADSELQQKRFGKCLQRPLPLAMASGAPTIEGMYVRTPFGVAHTDIRRKVEVLSQKRPQNRPVIAIAQSSGAGKTKAALSAAMCESSFGITGEVSASNASIPSSYLAVYALFASGSVPSSGVRAFKECAEEIQSCCDTYCSQRPELTDDAKLQIARFFDGLYLRLFKLLLATYTFRAATLAQEIRRQYPTSGSLTAEMLVRAQFLSQDYNLDQGIDAIRHLFNKFTVAAASEADLSSHLTSWSTLARNALGQFYVVYDEVCTLLPLCPGLCLHDSDVTSATTQSAAQIIQRQVEERNAGPSLDDSRTSMFYMLRRYLTGETSSVHIVLDTQFRIWKPILDATPASARLTIEEVSHLPAITPDQCLAFLQHHFTIDNDVTSNLFAQFAGRPLFFFDNLLPDLITILLRDQPASLSVALLTEACTTGFTAAVNGHKKKINALLKNKQESRPNDRTSSPSYLFTRCYVEARLANGQFTAASADMMHLISMGMVCLPQIDTSSTMLSVDFSCEPITWSAMPLSDLGHNANLEADLPLAYLAEAPGELTKEVAKLSNKGYYAESALAWAIMRCKGKKLLHLGSLNNTSIGMRNSASLSLPTLSWLHTLQLSQSSAVTPQSSGCSLFALYNEGAPARCSKVPRPEETIVFPEATMGPDLLLYFPSIPERTFPVIVCIQAKAKENESLRDALYSVNPGMFYASNREKFLKSPLSVSPTMEEWTSHHQSHRQVRFVRMLFSVRPFPAPLVKSVEYFNQKTGELGEKHPILLLESSAALWSNKVHGSLTRACGSIQNSWSMPFLPATGNVSESANRARDSLAATLQFAYSTREEAVEREWKYIKETKEGNKIVSSKLTNLEPFLPTALPAATAHPDPDPRCGNSRKCVQRSQEWDRLCCLNGVFEE